MSNKRRIDETENLSEQPSPGLEEQDVNAEVSTRVPAAADGPLMAPVHQEPARQKCQDHYYFRDLYKTDPNFAELGALYPEFGALLKNGVLDFKDPKSMVQLTKTLLKNDFDLNIELPGDRLCPPVPNRHNYVLFLKSLLDSSTYHDGLYVANGTPRTGLDIGTGASAIYPLLGCSQRQSWDFVATDIDARSLEFAQRNVQLNGLQERIKVLGPRDPAAPLIPLDEYGLDKIDFTMTNPPFYESESEMAELARKKAKPPVSACTGAPNEMVTAGGEVGFVSRILEESLVLKERVWWYTSMLGKLESVEAIVGMLKQRKINNYAVTELVQGTKTRRWVVAWSFGGMRPGHDVACSVKNVGGTKVAPSKLREEVWRGILSHNDIRTPVWDLLHDIELLEKKYIPGSKDGPFQWTGRTMRNTWSRAWRRRQIRGDEADPEHAGSKEDEEKVPEGKAAFGFCLCSNYVGRSAFYDAQEAIITIDWKEGHQPVLFESFCGFLKGRLKEKLEPIERASRLELNQPEKKRKKRI